MWLGISIGIILLLVTISGAPKAFAAEAPVDLGTAGSYSVLGAETVTNTGPSVLGSDLGVSPGSAITGFPPGFVGGALHAGDAPAAQAQLDVGTAYDDAAGRALTESVAGDLGGTTKVAGVYKSTSTLSLTGTVTLDGQNDLGSVFIFQIASGLTTASNSTVALINGAQACNVFWQVGSDAILGTGTTFRGTVLASRAVSVGTGSSVEGRVFARTAQVSLDTNLFTTPGCQPPVTETSVGETETSTPTNTSSTDVTDTSDTSTSTSDTVSTADTSSSGAGVTTTGPSAPGTTTTTGRTGPVRVPPTTTTTTTTATSGPTSNRDTPVTGGGLTGGGGAGGGGGPLQPTPPTPPSLAVTGTSSATVPLIGVGVLLVLLGAICFNRSQPLPRHRA